jgi:RNA polymerase sigma-70 factor (ECF subfamily)
MNDALQKHCDSVIGQMFERCHENAPNFGVSADCFSRSLNTTLAKFEGSSKETLSDSDVTDFLGQIQADDLFMAIACANGNERAWWEFDQQHRAYMERVARHLARTEMDATDIVDAVYEQLYGTRIVDGERVSKFSTYSGRGSIRGWLRTVIWHSLVDRHRAGHDEVSLDEMTENVGEGGAHANFAEQPVGGDETMVDQITRDRYRTATVKAIQNAFNTLEDHEKLILLYYHVENLKLREISRLVESEDSPLRAWFQRKSATREKNPAGRIHESTVMRWLEKCYAKVLQSFRSQLVSESGLSEAEIAICTQLATQDLAGNSFFNNLNVSRSAAEVSN